MAKVDKVMLGDQVTGPLGLVVVTPPTAGVRDLVRCPDALPSEGKAVAGKSAEWKWQGADGRVVEVRQYTAVYQGVSGRDVLKEARSVATCHEKGGASNEGSTFYSEGNLPSTKKLVDDRFEFCERQPTNKQDTLCSVLLAKGDVVTAVTIHRNDDGDYSVLPQLKDFVPALTDQLFA
jgi:hypothetical protein